jgi:hypothetical protein
MTGGAEPVAASLWLLDAPDGDDPAWRLLEPGELLRVDMTVDSAVIIASAPEELLELSDLHLDVARSQHPTGATGDDPVV